LKKKYNYDKHVFFANGNYMNEDKVYLGCWGTNRIIIFHMDNYDMDLICIDEENAEILSICGKENALFILLKGGKVVIMDINTFEKIVLDVNKENKSEIWGNSEGRMGVYLDYLYVFPDDMEFTKKINISNGHTEKVFDDEVMRSMRGNYEQIKFLFGTFDHGIVYWYSNIGDIYWCDVENSKDIKHIHLKYNPDEIQQWLQANMHTEKTMFEDKYLCTLSTLCHHVIGNDEITSNYDNSKNVGNIIYTNI
jgi:hypothetical protein